ncbi:MAG: parvulin peptidyl-prolyl isomerase [Frankiales bacterium]|nr:parvulin peptidyl-prolyl isomerase [Frankiales bacterium]
MTVRQPDGHETPSGKRDDDVRPSEVVQNADASPAAAEDLSAASPSPSPEVGQGEPVLTLPAAAPQDVVAQGSAPQDVLPHVPVSQDMASQDVAPQASAAPDVVRQVSVSQDVGPTDAVPKDPAPQNVPHADPAAKNAAPADTAPAEAALTDDEAGRPRRPRTRALAAALGLLVVGAVAAGALLWAPWTGLPEDAAFQVGDTVVTEVDVQRRTDVLSALYGVQVPQEPDRLDAFRRDTAKAMAISEVLDRAAQEEGIAVADKTVSDALDRFLLQRYPEGGRPAYVQALAARGVGEQDVLEEIRRQLEVRDLFDRTTEDVTVSDEQLREVFEADPSTYAVPERRQLRHIVVADEATARAVLRRVAAKEPFAAVAKQVSLDGSTKDNGGVLGLLSASELDPAFAQVAFAVAPASVFGPVQTALGWHVGVVDRVEAGKPTTFEQVVVQLREQQETERAVARWRDYVRERVEDAEVEYAAAYRPADPRPDLGEAPVQGPAASAPASAPAG